MSFREPPTLHNEVLQAPVLLHSVYKGPKSPNFKAHDPPGELKTKNFGPLERKNIKMCSS